MRPFQCFLALVFMAGISAGAAEGFADKIVIYPVDRATILAGAKFDVKIEFPQMLQETSVKIAVNGTELSEFFKQKARFIDAEEFSIELDAPPPPVSIPLRPIDARLGSAVLLRGCSIDKPGKYILTATDGALSASVEWEVYQTPAKRVAKNVILMVGDGMSLGHRVAARVLSKGIKEGKYNGKLAMDSLAHMALLATSGVDSIVTDSANSAHAYTTGHKSSDEALGVYADRTRDPFDDPQVENITSLARRLKQMSVGIVTTTEVQDATPASMVAHTRKRGKFPEITRMLFEAHPDVLMGGGSRLFTAKLPGDTSGTTYLQKFKDAHYTIVRNKTELTAASADPSLKKVLGLYNTGNMDGILDRKFLQPKYIKANPDQPDLEQMAQVALDVLSKNENGFVLMIESGLIDKFTHNMDWERAVMETIMYDKTIAVVREFMKKNPDTLLLVTADHCHGISICGTVDDHRPQTVMMRDKVGTGAEAGYPNYIDANGDGYPDSVNVSKRLAVFVSAFPDYYETFAPKLDGVFMPTMRNPERPLLSMANEKYKNVPGALLRVGNLPRNAGGGVHAADDVILTADGPGSESVRGGMDNTDVFRLIVNALALSPPQP